MQRLEHGELFSALSISPWKVSQLLKQQPGCLYYNHLNFSYQDAVEELVHKEPQDTGHDVADVVQEFHIHDHGLVATDEGASVAHEAHHEHDLVGQLGMARNGREWGLMSLGRWDSFLIPQHVANSH